MQMGTLRPASVSPERNSDEPTPLKLIEDPSPLSSSSNVVKNQTSQSQEQSAMAWQASLEPSEAVVEQVQAQSDLTPAEQAGAIVEQVGAIEGLTPNDDATDTMIEGIKSLDLAASQQAETIVEALSQMEKPASLTEADHAQWQLDKMIEIIDDLGLPPKDRAETLIQGIIELERLAPEIQCEAIIEALEHLPQLTQLSSSPTQAALSEALESLSLPYEVKQQTRALIG